MTAGTTALAPPGLGAGEDDTAREGAPAVDFDRLYAENLDVVWRGLRGLGVDESSIEDAVQDVFLIVHRRLAEFEARSTSRTWLFGIAIRVARNHRRRVKRKGALDPLDERMELPAGSPLPDDEAATAEALRRLVSILSGLDEQKREVFVLAELEQMSAPEIAEAIGINVNTVYSRLRAARGAFAALVTASRENVR